MCRILIVYWRISLTLKNIYLENLQKNIFGILGKTVIIIIVKVLHIFLQMFGSLFYFFLSVFDELLYLTMGTVRN